MLKLHSKREKTVFVLVLIISVFGFLNSISSSTSSYIISMWRESYELGKDLTAQLTLTYTSGVSITRPFIEGVDGHLEPSLEKKYYMFVRHSTNFIFGSFDNAIQTMRIVNVITTFASILPIIQIIQNYRSNDTGNMYFWGNYPKIFTVKH